MPGRPFAVMLPPGSFDLRPILQVLEEVRDHYPGIMIESGMAPQWLPRPIDGVIYLMKRDLREMPVDARKLFEAPIFFWAYDDLGYVVILGAHPQEKTVSVIMRESDEFGMPTGRPSLGAQPGRRRFLSRSERKPLIDTLEDLGRVHPGVKLLLTSRVGGPIGPDTPEGWISWIEKAIEDPRIKPLAKRRLTGNFFFWTYDELGFVAILVYDPFHRVIESMPIFEEVQEGGLPVGRPSPMMGADVEEPLLPSEAGPWDAILAPLGDAYTDFVRKILLRRLKNAVVWLGLDESAAEELAYCMAQASTVAEVNQALKARVKETLDKKWIGEVGRLLRTWQGSALYSARPELYHQHYVRARSWYLYLMAAEEVEDRCGIHRMLGLHRTGPDEILMTSAWYGTQAIDLPQVN